MKKETTLKLCEFALLVALEVVMSLTPLGFLDLGFLSASLLTIPVAVGAILLGTAASTLLGLTFGVISFIKGFSSAAPMTVAMYAMSIPASFVVAVVGRVLMGLCTGLLVKAVRRVKPKGIWDNVVGSLAAPLLNTAFFMGLLMLLFYHSEYIQGIVETTGVSNPILLIGVMVGTQALIEAAACGVIATAVSKTLQKVLHRE